MGLRLEDFRKQLPGGEASEILLAPREPPTAAFLKPLPSPSAEPSMGYFLASARSLMELK